MHSPYQSHEHICFLSVSQAWFQSPTLTGRLRRDEFRSYI